MAGAGTIGLELLEDLPGLTDVVISIGGGGLISGITVAINALKPEARIWGVETEGSETMGQALQAGRVVQITPTSLAKTLGSPYIAEDALALMQRHPEQYVLVSDREAFEAGVFLLERAKLNTELAASCTLAAARRLKASSRKAIMWCSLSAGGTTRLTIGRNTGACLANQRVTISAFGGRRSGARSDGFNLRPGPFH